MLSDMDWKPRDWTWTPRIDEGLGWLCRTLPKALIFPLYAVFNIERWEFRRIWGRLKAYTSSYYFIALVVIAVFAAPLWLDLVYRVRTDLFALFDAGPVSGENGESNVSGHYQTIAILIGVLAALFTAPLALLKAYINERQTNAAEEGLITDRFTKAVEQLGAEKTIRRREFRPKYQVDDDGNWIRDDDGNPIAATRPDGEPLGNWDSVEETVPNLEVRLGAIYALERIAQDSERDHIPIMETLCAYIRQNAPASSAKNHNLGDWELLPDGTSEEDRKVHLERQRERFGSIYDYSAVSGSVIIRSKASSWARGLDAPRVDVQAALTVIGRRPEERIAHEARSGFRLDLRAAKLQRADISSLNLSRANLQEARLEGTKYWRALLEGADLRHARLEGADLRQARLEGADLRWARLEGADLREARLEGADLREARLEGADLREARLEGAVLYKAWLEGANLREARLGATDLREALLEGADLAEAKLDGSYVGSARLAGASLLSTRLVGVHLGGAQLKGARFMYARFEGTDLSNALLEGADLERTVFNNANLWYARLDGANFWEAQLESTELKGCTCTRTYLRMADLSGAKNLCQDQVNAAFGDSKTKLPQGVASPDHWDNEEIERGGDDPKYRAWLDAGAPPGKPRETAPEGEG